jgi:hypothetical protein
MKRNLLLPVSAFVILIFGILGFSKPSTEFSHFVTVEKIPDTPKVIEIIKTVERAYDIEAQALYTI